MQFSGSVSEKRIPRDSGRAQIVRGARPVLDGSITVLYCYNIALFSLKTFDCSDIILMVLNTVYKQKLKYGRKCLIFSKIEVFFHDKCTCDIL